MNDERLGLHFLVLKQLQRENINLEDIPPELRDAWLNFISRVSRTYHDQDQERYIVERSLDISARELMELNRKLELAQKVAHLGYWLYDKKLDRLIWSNETFHLAGFDPSEGTPSLAEVLTLIHDDDRPKLERLMARAFNEGKDYEIELRFKNKKEGVFNWHYAKGHPHISLNPSETNYSKPIRYLSGVAIDITEKKLLEENIKKINEKLLFITENADKLDSEK